MDQGLPAGTTLGERPDDALQDARAMLEAIVDNILDIVFCVDTHSYRLLAFNRSFVDDVSGRTGIDVQPGMCFDDVLVTDEERLRWQALFQRALAEGPFTTDDVAGTDRPRRQLTFRPVKHEDEVFGISVFARDPTVLVREAGSGGDELHFHRAAQAAGIGIFDDDLVAGVSYWSAEARAIVGVAADGPAPRYGGVPAFVHPDDAGPLNEALRQAFDPKGQGAILNEHRVLWPDGQGRWVQLKGQVAFAGKGIERHPVRFSGAVIDVDERRNAEEARRRSEERLAVAARVARVGVFDADLVGGSIDWSAEIRSILGISAEAPLPRDVTMPDSIHADDIRTVRDTFRRAFDPAGDGILVVEPRCVWPDGRVRRIELRGQVEFAGDEATRRPVRIRGTVQDVTERKDAAEALEQRSRQLDRVLEQAPIGFAVYNIDDGSARFVSARFEEICGCVGGAITSHRTFFDIVWPRDPDLRERIRSRIVADITSGDVRRMYWENLPVPLPTGETRYITVASVPFFDQNVMVSTVQDVTERARVNERLRESEERFRQMAESVSDFVWEVDAEGLYTYASPSVEKILGYAPEELVGKMHFYDFFRPEERERLKSAAFALFTALEPFRGFSHAGVSASGEVVSLETSGVALLGPGGRFEGCRGVDTDVTARRRAEEQLRRYALAIEEHHERREGERDSFEETVAVGHTLGIVGESPAIKEVVVKARRVGPTTSSVLITGETGTGKELIAHAIHQLSPRRGREMVTVNCAALPTDLAESELFGHEKGAFTGAVATQVGRFELADGSTLFLDEIGELNPELQAKLLRVLDEGQFERLGGGRPRTVDVRLIAATNRDLSEELRKGRFRKDLYYRLNVFPIQLPPLRDRIEDLPLLVWYFVEQAARRTGKVIDRISSDTMQQLREHAWPGNVRELSNVIERAVVLSTGRTLSGSPSWGPTGSGIGEPLTLEEVERRHILQILTRTGWRISGTGGAADLLDVHRTTLQSMLKRLGISRQGSD